MKKSFEKELSAVLVQRIHGRFRRAKKAANVVFKLLQNRWTEEQAKKLTYVLVGTNPNEWTNRHDGYETLRAFGIRISKSKLYRLSKQCTKQQPRVDLDLDARGNPEAIHPKAKVSFVFAAKEILIRVIHL